MKRSRFSETQIVKILKEAESGRQVKDICREYGVTPQTTTGSPNMEAWKPQTSRD
ncbi:hypothetical protein ADMFC3_08830 [Geovibrio sp. ADMFC3]|jgi:transposase-like protein